MIIWVNALSACAEVSETELAALVDAMPSLPVYSTVEHGSLVGRVLRAEVRAGVDLWAEIEIEAGQPFERAAAVLGKEQDGTMRALAVMVTNLPREAIRALSHDRESKP